MKPRDPGDMFIVVAICPGLSTPLRLWLRSGRDDCRELNEPFDVFLQQRESIYYFLISFFRSRGPGDHPLVQGYGDEPPMTACGGYFIGGEISRNEQCPHEADLRRLRLRIKEAP